MVHFSGDEIIFNMVVGAMERAVVEHTVSEERHGAERRGITKRRSVERRRPPQLFVHELFQFRCLESFRFKSDHGDRCNR